MGNHVTSLSIHFIETTGHKDWSEVCAEANALAPLFKEVYERLIPPSFPFKIKPTPEEGVLDIDGKEFKTLSIGAGILRNGMQITSTCLFSLLKDFPRGSTPYSILKELSRLDWSDELCKQYGCFVDYVGMGEWWHFTEFGRLIRCPNGSTWYNDKADDEQRNFFEIAKDKLYELKVNQDIQAQ